MVCRLAAYAGCTGAPACCDPSRAAVSGSLCECPPDRSRPPKSGAGHLPPVVRHTPCLGPADHFGAVAIAPRCASIGYRCSLIAPDTCGEGIDPTLELL